MNPQDYVHTTVATVVARNGRYLMVEEHAAEGIVINQPAGHVEPGESLVQAAQRETLEETACEVVIEGLLGMALYTASANGVSYLRTTFHAQLIAEHAGRALDEGIIRSLWMSPTELRSQSDKLRSPLVLASVEQHLAGHHWPLDFIYYNP